MANIWQPDIAVAEKGEFAGALEIVILSAHGMEVGIAIVAAVVHGAVVRQNQIVDDDPSLRRTPGGTDIKANGGDMAEIEA